MVKSESRCYKSCQRSHKPAFIPESLLLHLWADTASHAASHSKGRVGPFQRCQGHSRWLRFAAGLGGHCSDPSVNVSAPWKLLAVGDRGEWSILTRKRQDAGSNHKSQTLLKHGFKGTKEWSVTEKNPTAMNMKTVAQYIVIFFQIKQPTDFVGLWTHGTHWSNVGDLTSARMIK